MSDCPYIVDVDANSFQQIVIDNSFHAPVLVDFWAEWCNPCQTLIPLLHKITEEMNGQLLLAKVNSDEQQELTAQYGVRSLPTVKLFRNGEVVEEFMGVQPETVIRDLIEPYLVRESDQTLAEAMSLYEQGEVEQALQRFQQIADTDPDNHKALLIYASLLAERGQNDEAVAIVNLLPEEKKQADDIKALIMRLEFAGQESDIGKEELLTRLEDNANDHEARYLLANIYIAEQDYEQGMAQLLELMKRDRQFKDDIARLTLLKVFDMLGGSGPLVSEYRKKMTSLLF